MKHANRAQALHLIYSVVRPGLMLEAETGLPTGCAAGGQICAGRICLLVVGQDTYERFVAHGEGPSMLLVES